MKTKIIFILFIMGMCISCSNDITDYVEDTSCVTRTVVDASYPSISNPELLNNWENVSEIVLNTLGTDTKNNKVDAPWSIHGTSSSLTETFLTDIKKEDGWKMLFHTFREVSLAPKLNYMCFYNQFTGFLKIFYYYEGGERNSGTQWFIRTSEGKNVKMLDNPTYLSKTDSELADNYMLLISNMNNNPSYGIDLGWNGFEFQVSRYSTDLSSMYFQIGAYDRQITNYNFLGKLEQSTVGTITSTSQSNSGISKAIANIAGPEAERLVDKLGKKAFGDKVVLGKKISNLISSIPTSGFISAIKGGLSMIFGKTTTTTTSKVNLTTTGSVEISGTSSTILTAGIPTLSFNLYEVLNSINNPTDVNLVSNVVSTNNHYLGVWTLKRNPVVYYDRVVPIYDVQRVSYTMDGKKMEIKGHVRLPVISHSDLEVIINPDLLPYIKKVSHSISYMVCDSLDGCRFKNNTPDIHDYTKCELIYSDNEKCFRNESPMLDYTVCALVDTPDSGVNPGYLYDWGNVRDGRLLAVVTLYITYFYLGKEVEVSQSCVYNVNYGVDSSLLQPETVHHPPYAMVVNYGNSFTKSRFHWE